MNTYKVDRKKKKKCLSQMRATNEKYKWLRTLDAMILPVGVIIGIIYVLYEWIGDNHLLPIGLIIVAVIIAILMTKLSIHMLFINISSNGFIERMNETITLVTDGLIYSNHSIQSNSSTSIISSQISYRDIEYVKYNRITNEMIVKGQTTVSEYTKDKMVSQKRGTQIKILNYFECDLIEILKKNNVRVEE